MSKKEILALIIAIILNILLLRFLISYEIKNSEHYKDLQEFDQIEAFLTQSYNL